MSVSGDSVRDASKLPFHIARSEIGANPRYGWEIRIPASFVPSPNDQFAPLSGSKYHSLAMFEAAAFPGSTISVAVTRLARDVSPEDWLRIEFERSQVEVRGILRRISQSPKAIEVAGRTTRDGEPVNLQSLSLMEGDRMFIVSAVAPRTCDQTLLDQLRASVMSFRLLQRQGPSTAEPLVESTFRAPLPFKFQRPASWSLDVPESDQGRRTVRLTARCDEKDMGFIKMRVYAPCFQLNLSHLAAYHAEDLKARGMHLAGAAILPIHPPLEFAAAAIFDPNAYYGNLRFVAPVLLLETTEALLSIGLLSPSREVSPYWWAVNKRAFEIVRDSLRVGAAAEEGGGEVGGAE